MMAPGLTEIPIGDGLDDLLGRKLAKRLKNEDGCPLYPDYMPFYDPLEQVHDVSTFDHHDPGHRAGPNLPNLLASASNVRDLSPHCGAEINGVQLGALVFRNQDFRHIGFEAQRKIVRHFGPLHIHGWAPHPVAGWEENMIIYDHKDRLWKGRSPVQWHTDLSPEPQPPGTTFICTLESQSRLVFNALSLRFRKRLEGLTAIHSNNDGISQELKNGTGAVIRRAEPTQSHPVTSETALYDLQGRVRYEAGMVLLWDQRMSCHSQTMDYPAGERRHRFRWMILANKPVPSIVEEIPGRGIGEIHGSIPSA
ncbi:hypothetical protein BCR34DRAFT_677559 [Clohesyomyces aquaticus]|uniref:TauD/TfdA-like domain-containing protein n=1 Tax=Clohesyomyces aquaticus TaxID=1231657 RepID=A0A1Y1YAV5_9PLEO|nr:hypothetical protein BCR34DRAFT_677559 [Clohesyomyces aquaticus]